MTNGLNTYRLSLEEIESLLQNNYKDKIEPVDSVKLQQAHDKRQKRLPSFVKTSPKKNEVPEKNDSL